ncbi:uncharacterized protein BYT42DRAFT_642956 [Radiomyces spectabilis]|uniref:uncharacterized protein n=1 Tax=Radiomyces spectabilis TaxID=64574 RepID=UPI00221E8F54|nr:uncharacterized protein BYT42DRAFT_642956 [Radiomyces spectabilis]KAI8388799.1 hypothetical protein BYT42DRAFT_642956 [Radiomyces spectabilis]
MTRLIGEHAEKDGHMLHWATVLRNRSSAVLFPPYYPASPLMEYPLDTDSFDNTIEKARETLRKIREHRYEQYLREADAYREQIEKQREDNVHVLEDNVKALEARLKALKAACFELDQHNDTCQHTIAELQQNEEQLIAENGTIEKENKELEEQIQRLKKEAEAGDQLPNEGLSDAVSLQLAIYHSLGIRMVQNDQAIFNKAVITSPDQGRVRTVSLEGLSSYYAAKYLWNAITPPPSSRK